jgi:peroxiredoxin Q/BCP
MTTPSIQAVEEAAAARVGVVGLTAPGFALPNQDGRIVDLSDFSGRWVVLYFYPKDDTPGCSCQATEFTHLLGEYGKMEATVIGISPDSWENHRFFARKYGLRLTLLSDPKLDTLRSYGAWAALQCAGIDSSRVLRSTFLINPQGKIAFYWPEVIPQGHAERVREKLQMLQGQGAGRGVAAR